MIWSDESHVAHGNSHFEDIVLETTVRAKGEERVELQSSLRCGACLQL